MTETGKVGQANFTLSATVTVTNHQENSITVSNQRPDPPYAPFVLRLSVPPDTQDRYVAYPSVAVTCQACEPLDVATITAGASKSWTVETSLADVPAKDFHSGVTYDADVVLEWHMGPLVVDGKLTTMEAEGAGQITLK